MTGNTSRGGSGYGSRKEVNVTLNVGEIIARTPLPVPDVKAYEDAETGFSEAVEVGTPARTPQPTG